MVAPAELRLAANLPLETSRCPLLLNRRLSSTARWYLHYLLRGAAEEIEDLRAEVLRLTSKLEAVCELASEEPEE